MRWFMVLVMSGGSYDHNNYTCVWANLTYDHGMLMHYVWPCSMQFLVGQILWTYVIPVLIVLGTIGNTVAVAILCRKNLKQWSMRQYMITYVVVNTIILYINCGLDWISQVTEMTYVSNLSDWMCRVWQFIFNVILYATGWLVVGMVFDRFLIVWSPHKAQQVCTVFISKLVLVGIFVGLVVVSVHAMWTYELVQNYGCIVDLRDDIQTKTWPIVSAALYSYIPIVIILVMTMLIIFGMMHPNLNNNSGTVQDKFTQATVAIALTYLAFSLPTIIINLIEYFCSSDWIRAYDVRVQLLLARSVGQVLGCLNSSVTFFIYFAFVPMMRREVMVICSKLRGHRRLQMTELRLANGSTVKTDEGTLVTLL